MFHIVEHIAIVLPGRAAHPGEPLTFLKTAPNFTRPTMSHRKNARKPLDEADIQRAI